jgi:hypothetical protein
MVKQREVFRLVDVWDVVGSSAVKLGHEWRRRNMVASLRWGEDEERKVRETEVTTSVHKSTGTSLAVKKQTLISFLWAWPKLL